jgi:hypothetical protein
MFTRLLTNFEARKKFVESERKVMDKMVENIEKVAKYGNIRVRHGAISGRADGTQKRDGDEHVLFRSIISDIPASYLRIQSRQFSSRTRVMPRNSVPFAFFESSMNYYSEFAPQFHAATGVAELKWPVESAQSTRPLLTQRG